MISRSMLAWIPILLVLGCAAPLPHPAFEDDPVPTAVGGHPNRTHPPLVTLEDFQRMDRAEVEILSDKGAGAGVTGARKLVVLVGERDTEITLKSKDFPDGLDGSNNSPRRELAAYAIQRLFLEPTDYVVPTFGVRCIALGAWEARNTGAPTQIPGTECALISYAFWLDDVTLPDPLFDEKRFSEDPRYALLSREFQHPDLSREPS